MNTIKDPRLDNLFEKPEFSSFKSIADNSIFIISPNSEKYMNDSVQIKMDNKVISKQLLIDLLSHDDSYELISKMFKRETSYFITFFLDENAKFICQYNFSKRKVLSVYNEIKSDLSDELLSKYKEFVKLYSFDNYIETHKDEIYHIKIDDNEYDIRFIDIIDFLKLDKDMYMMTSSNECKMLYGIEKEKFVYAVSRYFRDNEIDGNYSMDESIEDRLIEINDSKYIDIEAYNRINEIDDFNFDKIKIDQTLKNYLLYNIPRSLNNLEKAIYIYIKMNKMFTYD